MNTLTAKFVFFAIPSLVVSGLIVSMDPSANQNHLVALLMPTPRTHSLFYMPQSKCDGFNALFPNKNITHFDPFIQVVSLAITPEDAKIINASAQLLYTPHSPANQILLQLPAEQRKIATFPSKFFHNLEDGDTLAECFTLGKGFNQYRETCTNNFRKNPKFLTGCGLEFINAGIVTRGGSHGPNSHYATAHLDVLPIPQHMNIHTTPKKEKPNQQNRIN